MRNDDSRAWKRDVASIVTLMRYKGFLYLRISVAVLLTFFIVQLVDFKEVLRTIASSQIHYMPLMVALALFDRYLMAYKWALLLRVRGVVLSNLDAFKICLTSGFVGKFLPTGVGADVFKLARTTLAVRRAEKVTASIFMERIIGLFAITILALGGLSALVFMHETQFLKLYYFAWVVLAMLVLLLVLSLKLKTHTPYWLRNFFAPIKRYKVSGALLMAHAEYIELSQHKKVLGWFLVLSLIEHGTLSLMCFVGAQSLGLPVTLVYFFAIIPITSFLNNLPISVSAIGVQEGVYIMLFALAGLSTTQSLSFSFFMRAFGFLMMIPGGLLLLRDTLGTTKLTRSDTRAG